MRWVFSAISALGLAAALWSAAPGDALPDGKGRETVLRMCSHCHALDRVTTARYAKKHWSDVVDDMVSRGAEGTDEELTAVVVYLSRNFGKPVDINACTAQEIEDGLSFTAPQAESIVRRRAEQGKFKTYEDLLKVPGLDAALLEEQKNNIVF